MATDYGVRQGLLGKGVANEDIGFDPNTGFVQVKGQNFLKPEMNVQGTTYTTKSNFDNAYNQYARNQKQQQEQSLTNQYLNNVSNPSPQTQDLTNQYIQRITQPQQINPYANQLTGLIAQIQQRMNQPQQDVYSTPQYAAAKAREQQAAQQGIRAAQESLGSAGFGRSTTLANAANRIQNQANQNLELQLVPQIQNQLQQQRQQELSNFYNLLNPITNQANRFDQQSQQGNANLLNVINLLNSQGRAQNQDLAGAIGLLNNQNQQQAQNDRADAGLQLQQQDQALRERQINAQLTGFMPDGTPTNAYQQQQLQNQWKLADELQQVTPFLSQVYGIPAGTPTYKARQDVISNMMQQAQLAISQRNSDISRQNSAANIANMEADNARQDNALKLTNDQRDFAGQVAGELGQATSKQDVIDFFNKNAAEITSQLGADATAKMKSDALSQFDTTKADAAKASTRDKAISAAQNDFRWKMGTPEQKADLIKEYEGYYQ